MKTKRARRAPSADWLAMTPADREAVRTSRFQAQSGRHQREKASEKSFHFNQAQPQEPTK